MTSADARHTTVEAVFERARVQAASEDARLVLFGVALVVAAAPIVVGLVMLLGQ